MNKKKKDEDTRRKIVLGAIILADAKKNESLRNYVVALLGSMKERDKELFSEFLTEAKKTTSGQ